MQPHRLFHVTPFDNIYSILAQGLIFQDEDHGWETSSVGRIFLTDSEYDLLEWALQITLRLGREIDFVAIEIDPEGLELTRQITDIGLVEYVCSSEIPLSKIKDYWVIPEEEIVQYEKHKFSSPSRIKSLRQP